MLKSLVVKLKIMGSGTDALAKAKVQRGKAFLSNVRGVAFYAVPHGGSNNFTEYATKFLSCNKSDLAQLMENIKPSQRDMVDLSVEFAEIVTENEIIIYAFCEARRMEEVVRMWWRKWIFATKHL